MNIEKKQKVLFLYLLIISVSFCGVTEGQTLQFTEKTGDDNPLENVVTVSSSMSSPVDIDNDGDFDLFIGDDQGRVKFYKNIGTDEEPNLLEEQIGEENPLNNIHIEGKVFPEFVDIDGDLDLDVFLGAKNKIIFCKNTGSVSSPIFIQQSGENNPLLSIASVGNRSYFPSFIDIDFDNDIDVFIGWIDFNISENGQGISYYKNIGTFQTPIFENQLNENNPFDNFHKLYPIPTFFDLDGDVDLDVFIEKGNGEYLYFENTSDAIVIKVNDVELDLVEMYPNPAKSEVTFNIVEKEASIRVFSMLGSEIYRTIVTKDYRTINVQDFDSGIYLILIESEKFKITKKLVVKK